MPILEVKNIKKGFGETDVLKAVSFSLEHGQFHRSGADQLTDNGFRFRSEDAVLPQAAFVLQESRTVRRLRSPDAVDAERVAAEVFQDALFLFVGQMLSTPS